MSRLTKFLAVVAAFAVLALPASAQPVYFYPTVTSVAGFSGSTTTDGSCILVKYVGTAAGVADVAVAAGGDITLRVAAVADATTGSPSLNGVFDLSTPAAAVDTMGELVSLINTTGSNWRAVLTGCLASDLTDNALFTLSTTEANGPAGVRLTRDSTVASASAVFSAQVALLPGDAAVNIAFFLQGNKVAANPFGGTQAFVQHIRERITSTGTIALFEVLGVRRTYSGTGVVSETVRSLYAETGAATTVEKTLNFHNGPVVAASDELIVVRQRTGTDLTAQSINGSAYYVKVGSQR